MLPRILFISYSFFIVSSSFAMSQFAQKFSAQRFMRLKNVKCAQHKKQLEELFARGATGFSGGVVGGTAALMASGVCCFIPVTMSPSTDKERKHQRSTQLVGCSVLVGSALGASKTGGPVGLATWACALAAYYALHHYKKENTVVNAQ